MKKKLCNQCNKTIDTSKDRRKARKYCSFECYRLSRIGLKRNLNQDGKNNPNWKGGVRITTGGYILIYSPYHPSCSVANKYVQEHRLIMETYLGRFLKLNEVVHHKNGITTDNRIKNLELMTNREHSILHGRKRRIL